MSFLPKTYIDPSVFSPENLLREGWRQRSIPDGNIPDVCLLDPDGDLVHHLLSQGKAVRNPYWACYHTVLYDIEVSGFSCGIVGCAVGASFAVLVAEELFASGCKLIVSITSAGQIEAIQNPPYFILIEKALRDEGTSYHYLPDSEYSHIDDALSKMLFDTLALNRVPVYRGATWTTDAPFRETASTIAQCRKMGILAVEMEAAALYAFAKAKNKPVICLAHVTNQMASFVGDFEKGEANGSQDALRLLASIVTAWHKKFG